MLPNTSMTNVPKPNINIRIFILAAAASIILIAGIFVYKIQLSKRRAINDPVVAVVNDAIIHKSNLSVLSPPVPSSQALALLVDFKLIDLAASKKNITVSDTEMQRERQNFIGTQNTTYPEAAQKLGRSPEGLDLQLRHALMLQKLSALELTPEPKGMYHARGILVKSNGKHARSDAQALAYAQKLQREIAAGTDIAALAKLDSDDFISSPTGGDLGVIELSGAPNMAKVLPDFRLQSSLAKAVNTAQPGSLLGGPIQGDFGYWVVQVISTDSKPNDDAAKYQEVVSEWRSSWIARLEPGVMARLRSSAYIQPPLATSPQQKRG
jgi:parvulin-like peptidyl-prolyl isomerase